MFTIRQSWLRAHPRALVRNLRAPPLTGSGLLRTLSVRLSAKRINTHAHNCCFHLMASTRPHRITAHRLKPLSPTARNSCWHRANQRAEDALRRGRAVRFGGTARQTNGESARPESEDVNRRGPQPPATESKRSPASAASWDNCVCVARSNSPRPSSSYSRSSWHRLGRPSHQASKQTRK